MREALEPIEITAALDHGGELAAAERAASASARRPASANRSERLFSDVAKSGS